MSIDVFGRQLTPSMMMMNLRGPPGKGFQLTTDGQYDIQKKRLCNVAEPLQPSDAVTSKIMKDTTVRLEERITELATMLTTLDARLSALQKHLFMWNEFDEATADRIKNIDSRLTELEDYEQDKKRAR